MSLNFIDVCHGHLHVPEWKLQSFMALLSGDEKLKAESFKFPLLRNRYIAVRGLLRQTLAGYLDVDPVGLRFDIGQHGKPALSGGHLHFNLSHSADTLVMAVGNIADIGIDIEISKPKRDLAQLAERCFSAKEYQGWCQLPPAQQGPAFYRLWTKKEAFVKAVGRGIVLGVERCEFELVSGGKLLDIPAEYGPAHAWQVHELDVGEEACAALVTPDCAYALRRLALLVD